MSEKIKVKKEGFLLDYLVQELKGWSRNKLKKRLQTGSITVNDESTTQHNFPLKAEDLIVVGAEKGRGPGARLELLYSDKDIIAINKPAGLLSVATNSEKDKHALAILRKQLSKPQKPVKLWPVHRLDRDTSGVLLFATSREVREKISASWDKAEKTYLAIVEGCPKNKQGTIDQPLRMEPNIYQAIVGEHREAKKAVTHYELKESSRKRSLLEVKLETGRQHQIRAHMLWLGHSIVGDKRYGSSGPRMGLHAFKLKIIHPKTGEKIVFETEAPVGFMKLIYP